VADDDPDTTMAKAIITHTQGLNKGSCATLFFDISMTALAPPDKNSGKMRLSD